MHVIRHVNGCHQKMVEYLARMSEYSQYTCGNKNITGYSRCFFICYKRFQNKSWNAWQNKCQDLCHMNMMVCCQGNVRNDAEINARNTFKVFRNKIPE